jgi:Fusaric acid resistance protein-like
MKTSSGQGMPKANNPPLVPWLMIAGVVVSAILAPLVATSFGIQPAFALVGFMTGAMACIFGDRKWAVIAILIAVIGFGVLVPGNSLSLCLIGLELTILVTLSAPLGKSRAMANAAFGWVFLAFFTPETTQAADIAVFAASGIWGAIAAVLLRLEGIQGGDPEPISAHLLIAFLGLSAGFLTTILFAQKLGDDHAYWVPFVFIQLAVSAGGRTFLKAFERVGGAILGVFAVTLFAEFFTEYRIDVALALVCLVFGLRRLAANAILSRALMTAAVLLLLDPSRTPVESRLKAELIGAAILLASSALVAALSRKSRPTRDG